MLMGHIFGVLKDSFLYPFVNWKDINVVFLKTLVIYVVLGNIALWVTRYGLSHEALSNSLVYIVNVILALALFLAMMPLFVSVTRHAALGEAIDSCVLGRILKTREIMAFVAWVKWLFLLLIPILLTSLPMMLGLIEAKGGLAKFAFFLGFLIGFYLAIRGSMIVINAPLERDASIKKSFAMTSGTVLPIVGFLVGYLIIAMLLSTILFWLFTIFGGIVELEGLMHLSVWVTLTLTILYAFYDTIMGIIFVVGLARIYLLINIEK